MIGERIKELRIRNDLTQTDLARKLQLSRSAINAWEMGISIPSTQYIIELATLFKTSADYILEINREESINISDLSNEEKNIIYRLVRSFASNQFLVELLKKNNVELSEDDLDNLDPSISEYLYKIKKGSRSK